MHIIDTVELLYLKLMLRWNRTAPPNRHQGVLLNGEKKSNTQISRMAYVLTIVAASSPESTYSRLAMYMQKNDGEAYISKGSSRMTNPYPLSDGWFIDGCMNLTQKQLFLHYLTKLGLSSTFIACADDFVEGNNSLEKYLPTKEDDEKVLQNIQLHEDKSRSFLQNLTHEEQQEIHERILAFVENL